MTVASLCLRGYRTQRLPSTLRKKIAYASSICCVPWFTGLGDIKKNNTIVSQIKKGVIEQRMLFTVHAVELEQANFRKFEVTDNPHIQGTDQ